MDKNVQQTVEAIERMVNTFSTKQLSEEFNECASRMMHRTLQQSFTRLVLQWIEFVASDKYMTDGRNSSSQTVCRNMLNAFKERVAKEGYTGESLEIMSRPSEYCIMV